MGNSTHFDCEELFFKCSYFHIQFTSSLKHIWSTRGMSWLNIKKKCQDYVYRKWEHWSAMYKIKHYFRHENKVNETKVLYCKVLKMWTYKKQQIFVFPYIKLTDLLSFSTRFPKKVDQHTGSKWLIHGTKCCTNNQLQSLELPCRIS